MNNWDLRIFEAVARLGSISRAAAELNTVQSNVTTRMRLLEEELDIILLNRHSRGVVLTHAGLRLEPYAKRVLRLLEDARRAVSDYGEPRGPLALGAVETTAAFRLPRVLAAFAKAFPEVDLSLITGTTATLIDAVTSGHLDGAFVTAPVSHPELAAATVYHETLVLVTARSIRTFEQLSKIQNLRMIVCRAGCSYRRALEALLAKRGVVGLRSLEFGSLEAIVDCVAAGVGVTLLPADMISPASDAERVRTHKLSSSESSVETIFIWRNDSYASNALTEFLTMACVVQDPQIAESRVSIYS